MELQDLANLLLERISELDAKIDSTKDHVAKIDVMLARRDGIPARIDALEQTSQEHSDQMSKLRGGAGVLGTLAAVVGIAKWLWP